MSYAQLSSRRLVLGESWEIGMTLSRGGQALDLSVGTVTATLRLQQVGSSDPAVERSTANAGETRWPVSGSGDGTDGSVEFLFTQAESAALAAGRWNVEVIYEDTASTPEHKRLHARGCYAIEAPTTGAI